eukprot:TRINITY_DN13699_c0_g1_i1.p1 TRINITY_DN13699_c0_g1~~TRINITY_DN13699_c0_g1_i1.p1  ORF type:complete len:121 (-),score=3.49 TRINITY_DN13699_c0_g1_i1:235-597(-)
MNEVGSSVALSAPQSTYNASSQPRLNNQPDSLKSLDPILIRSRPTFWIPLLVFRPKGGRVNVPDGGEHSWTKLQSRVTNDDGRASNFLSWEEFQPGTYKMHFSTGQYFKERATESFYPFC